MTDEEDDLSPPIRRLIDIMAKRDVDAYLRDPVRYERLLDEGKDPLIEPQQDEKTCLYRHFAVDGRLLYVGVSNTPASRKYHHKWASKWFAQVVRTTEEWLPNRREALDAELRAIKAEHPIYNRQGQPREHNND